MTYSELSALVQKRASEAYQAQCDAKKLPPRKRAKAMEAVYRKQGACDLAVSILGEDCPDHEKEERIKAVFMEAFFS